MFQKTKNKRKFTDINNKSERQENEQSAGRKTTDMGTGYEDK
jgi:hypothetical protein